MKVQSVELLCSLFANATECAHPIHTPGKTLSIEGSRAHGLNSFVVLQSYREPVIVKVPAHSLESVFTDCEGPRTPTQWGEPPTAAPLILVNTDVWTVTTTRHTAAALRACTSHTYTRNYTRAQVTGRGTPYSPYNSYSPYNPYTPYVKRVRLTDGVHDCALHVPFSYVFSGSTPVRGLVKIIRTRADYMFVFLNIQNDNSETLRVRRVYLEDRNSVLHPSSILDAKLSSVIWSVSEPKIMSAAAIKREKRKTELQVLKVHYPELSVLRKDLFDESRVLIYAGVVFVLLDSAESCPTYLKKHLRPIKEVASVAKKNLSPCGLFSKHKVRFKSNRYTMRGDAYAPKQLLLLDGSPAMRGMVFAALKHTGNATFAQGGTS